MQNLGLFFLIIFSELSAAESFYSSKKKLAKIYVDFPETFYCSCPMNFIKGKPFPDLQACNYKFRKQLNRASRIEWEHVVPTSRFGNKLPCWKNGGRKNCRKDLVFKRMEADMHNLVPSVGEINGDRSNHQFGVIPGEDQIYGSCDFEINFKERRVEPKESIRGNIARRYLYFAQTYTMPLSERETTTINNWNDSYPVDEKECQIHSLISNLQGSENPFVKISCENF